MAFQNTSRNIRLEGNNLLAECKRIDGSWRSSSLPLDICLGNVNGAFKWGYKNFSHSARDVYLEGTNALRASLLKENGSYSNDARVDLGTNIVNADGALKVLDLPAVLAVPKESEQALFKQLGEALDKNEDMKVSIVEEKDGSTLWYVNAGANVEDGTFFKTFTADARASVMHTVQSKGRAIEQVNVDVFSANASFTMSGMTDGTGGGFPVYIGGDASLSLFKAQASVFDLNLGVGVETGVGIKDESLDAHVAGCGVTIGRKVSISAFGSSFGIDFGRFFN